MRAFLASSIGVTCAAALLLPLTTSSALTGDSTTASPPRADSRPPAADSGGARSGAQASGAQLPGSTQSLPMGSSAADSGGRAAFASTGDGGPRTTDLGPRKVRSFSLVGVVWKHIDSELHGQVQVRTHDARHGWSGWRELEAHREDGPDAGAEERAGSEARGSTAPLWVGDSDGVQARVKSEHALPEGLRLELVDPGPGGKEQSGAESGAGSDAGRPAHAAEDVSLTAAGADRPAATTAGAATADRPVTAAGAGTTARAEGPGPRPGIVTRSGWGADEGLREKGFGYTKNVRMAFLHHTAMSNNYRCSEVPAMLRSIYRYHVKSSKWRDIGYNFLIDKCGTIYEGRAGGVAKSVKGAHTYGFNTGSTGIAVLGSFAKSRPSSAAVNAVARLSAWKLGLHGVNPRGTTLMTSGGGTKFKKGTKVRFHTIAGHRDGFDTSCPGGQLYRKLGFIRATAGQLQGR